MCVYLCVFVAQVLEEDQEHSPLVAICHVLQEEISLDTTGWSCRYVDTQTWIIPIKKSQTEVSLAEHGVKAGS